MRMRIVSFAVLFSFLNYLDKRVNSTRRVADVIFRDRGAISLLSLYGILELVTVLPNFA